MPQIKSDAKSSNVSQHEPMFEMRSIQPFRSMEYVAEVGDD
eukprot:CAMPEP_0169281536 /NCGR_PEP_ID=MMETSP1016-20121227/56308_1 /TAXON_ID=342587 /ORGANISM="Karlodinium micrum, Strain CCMP2283" /LENGTH=40 /DNA_ID= /DNA_START= /DNA_END= /DNA_ORIENTATION=